MWSAYRCEGALGRSVEALESGLGENLGDRNIVFFAGQRAGIEKLGFVDQGEYAGFWTGVRESPVIVALAVPEARAGSVNRDRGRNDEVGVGEAFTPEGRARRLGTKFRAVGGGERFLPVPRAPAQELSFERGQDDRVALARFAAKPGERGGSRGGARASLRA